MHATLRFALATATAAALLSFPGAGQAVDNKAMPGASCMPYGALTSWSDLTFRPSGVYNGTTANKHVLCSVIHDAEAEWADGASADVKLFFKSQTGTPITCSLTVGSSLTTGAVLYTEELTLAPNATGQIEFLNVYGDDGIWFWNPVSVNCRMPPKTTLTRILVSESGATHHEAI